MSSRVYIGHLNSRASERDVEHFCRGFGRIRDVVLKSGFGFVVKILNLYSFIIFRNLMIFATPRMPFTSLMGEIF